jgi:hypothetical protein
LRRLFTNAAMELPRPEDDECDGENNENADDEERDDEGPAAAADCGTVTASEATLTAATTAKVLNIDHSMPSREPDHHQLYRDHVKITTALRRP